jgi:hypothetical protein
MKHMKTKFLIAGSMIMILSSCYTPRFAYSPTAHNVPVLTERNDSKLAFNYSTNADSRSSDDKYSRNRANGYDVQGAYAITSHVGLQGSYFSRYEKTISNASNDNYFDSSVISYNRHLFEFGAGYFTPIDTRQKIFFQVFGGVGFGKFDFTDNGKDINQNIYHRFHNADITKFYLEPAIIFRNTEVFAASLSTRFSLVNFRNIQTNYIQPEKEHFKLDSLDRYSSIFFEPAFVNSYGFNKLPGLRIEYQLGLSLLMSREILDYRRFNFSIGLVFDIPKLIRGAAIKSKD